MTWGLVGSWLVRNQGNDATLWLGGKSKSQTVTHRTVLFGHYSTHDNGIRGRAEELNLTPIQADRY